MIRDITIGQYYPTDSVIHRLDPRVKLLSTLIYIITLFVFRGILGGVLITAFLAVIIRLSRVPFRYMVKGLKAIGFLVLFTAVCNFLLTPGDINFLEWGPFTISDTGMINAVVMAARMIYLILGTSLMTLTTTPKQLTDGLEKSLRFLNVIHIPVHAIAMMMSISLRFIPILIEETDKIMKAQMARGAEFGSGGLVQRAKNLIPLLIPLFISAFRRADELAMAMESRCYNGGKGRTKMKPLRYKGRDLAAYGLILLYLAAVIAARIVLPFPE